ncbi:MAG: hypothetical protein HY298_23535 [Verrucomicrobia bacterium]|nr:hypothetical protein [Verrucomicrobiota bacterium]
MKTMNMVDEAVKIAGAPLVRFLRTGDNFGLREEEVVPSGPTDAPDGRSLAQCTAIAAPAAGEDFGCQETPRNSVTEGNSKVVRLATLARREVIVEAPRLDFVQGYLVRERRAEEALENFVFIVLWLGSLVALGCFVMA